MIELNKHLSLTDFESILFEGNTLAISEKVMDKVYESFVFLKYFSQNKIIYGVNTGFGPMAQYRIDDKDASQLQYNPSYLSRVFHEKTGMTLSAYIDEKKCTLAKELLKQGVNVGEVAERLGYASSQSFCKMFVRCVGCSPTAYLKQQASSK